MANLNAIHAEFNKIKQFVHALRSSRYQTSRDDHGNLSIQFEDGEETTIPAVKFRPYQLDVQRALFKEGKKRFFIERPRRSGKEVESWNLLVSAAIESPGLYLMIYPTNVRARLILWDGAIVMPDGSSKKFLEMIPSRFVVKKLDDEMKIVLSNGSVIRVIGSDIDPNKLRGANPRGIVLSEFAFSDPRVYYILLPILRQNGGWVLAQSTYNGMNHFYRLMQDLKKDDLWYTREDSILTLLDEEGQPYITEDMIDEDRRAGMPEYLIQQEYYGVVQLNRESMYFSHEMNHIIENERLIKEYYLPEKPLYTAWDIGINDATSVVLFQLKEIDLQLRPVIVGYIESNNRDLKYYIEAARQFANKYHLYIHSHYFPHDGQKRDFNTGKNTIDFLREMGELGFIVPRPPSKENAIEAMRQMLYITTFNKENTDRLIDCLSNYSKEYNEKLGVYKNQARHDWASHGVDAYQTMTLALNGNMIIERSKEIVYYHAN